ncbi:MAG: serine/threonine protein kinase [Myxococcales bacterium]|nr:serine/threonine protein kinase [Myxococcales bacterium]
MHSDAAYRPTLPAHPPCEIARAPVLGFGRFEVRGLLGTGGMGRVYRAFDPARQREVALKISHPRSAHRDWLVREAAIMAHLDHPGIVAPLDTGRHEGRFFLTMELVEGPTLRALLRQGPLAAEHAVRVAADLADALQHAHERGVVHRDVKPCNVLLEGERARLSDFGVALGADRPPLEPAGQILGTQPYMAPEQLRCDASAIGPQADVHALGVLLRECLTLSLPPTTQPTTDAQLEAICQRATHPDAAERTADMATLAAELRVWRRARPPRRQAPPSVDDLVLHFDVSRDEEHVQLLAVRGQTVLDLGSQAHNYLLLTLARLRRRDARQPHLAPSSHGWVDVDTLLGMLKINENKLNVDIHRARRRIGRAGIAGADQVVDRRRYRRQLRFGVPRFEIATL